MYISRLAIKNFRNFGDPAFVIGLRPFTLLLGENNVLEFENNARLFDGEIELVLVA